MLESQGIHKHVRKMFCELTFLLESLLGIMVERLRECLFKVAHNFLFRTSHAWTDGTPREPRKKMPCDLGCLHESGGFFTDIASTQSARSNVSQ